MTVFIQSLTLSHFRSHRRTQLAFDGRPVALSGPNGAGKTNVLEAVSLLSPGRGLRRAASDDLSRKPESLGWKIVAELATPNGARNIQTWAEPGQPRQVRIDDKPTPQIALASLLGMVWLTPAMDRLWLEGAEGRRRFLDRMVLSFHPDHAAQVLTYEKAMRERNKLLRDGLGDGAWYGALEMQMAQAGAQISANRRAVITTLASHADHDSPFPVADLTLDCAAPHDETRLARALSDGRRQDMAAGRSLTGPHRADLRAVWAAKGMDAAQCSTGEQKAMLISLILCNARALAETGTVPLLLLDEVAAHLDADRRAALYDAICGLRVQAFMTGTGRDLFLDLGARAQHFSVTDADGRSQLSESTL
ncbi:DNA replication/repair protein RecF [Roseinatronobacter alkalisoli]|uniref:DNA replication and repair protein RecF n=1 Tax=Roseinatronobacter alkalisoli TaxID=3028235 RepID=A0ABT5TAC2_9RHOB|nr:DNA replication/repair protein RecF [Roseinatronobacter sp. HJB301]MDD7972067.1 DNA replication/repair protein RecF [Roseinatronobacter sp. HJB301]